MTLSLICGSRLMDSVHKDGKEPLKNVTLREEIIVL
jgi:hypothetical protein